MWLPASTTPSTRYLVPKAPKHTFPSSDGSNETTIAGFTMPESETEQKADLNPFPREEIAALKSWCTAPHGSGCARCQAVCPTGALSLESGTPHINRELCTRCGMCAGICDAFAFTRITLEDLFTRAEREAKEEGAVCFTCNDHLFEGVAPRSNVIALPCLAAVPPEFWTALLANDVPVQLYLDESYCENCSVAGPMGPALYAHVLDQAQDWTGRAIERVNELPEREYLLAAWANGRCHRPAGHADKNREGKLRCSRRITPKTHRWHRGRFPRAAGASARARSHQRRSAHRHTACPFQTPFAPLGADGKGGTSHTRTSRKHRMLRLHN